MRGTVRKAVTSALKVVVLEVVPCWQEISFVFLQVAEATNFTNFAARIMTVMVTSDLDHLQNMFHYILRKLFLTEDQSDTRIRPHTPIRALAAGAVGKRNPFDEVQSWSFHHLWQIIASLLFVHLLLHKDLPCYVVFLFFCQIHYKCIVVWNPLPYIIYSNRIDLSTLSFMAAVLCLWTCQNMPSFQDCEAQYIS